MSFPIAKAMAQEHGSLGLGDSTIARDERMIERKVETLGAIPSKPSGRGIT